MRYRLRSIITCMDMQLRKSSDFRRPAPILSDSFGRTGRTHSVLRTQISVLSGKMMARHHDVVHPTGGSLRVFGHFPRLDNNVAP